MLEADSQTADHAASWVSVALEVSTRCDDDEPQLIRYPHRDHVAFEQRPIRIIRDYQILTLPLHLRKRGRSVLPNMMQVMNAITSFMKQPRRSPTPAS
jgi:hypothetical protein